MTKSRLNFLDNAKAIGIILVVLGHVINTQNNILPSGEIILQYIYSFHMPLFFIISGIILKIKLENPKYGASNVLRNLFFTYVSWCAIYILLNIYANPDNRIAVFLERSAASITGRGIAPLWFIFSLLFGTILTILLMRLKEKFKINNTIFFTTSLLLLIFITNLLVSIENIPGGSVGKYVYISLSRMFPSIFFILFGVLCSSQFNPVNNVFYKFLLCVIGLTLVITITNNNVNMHLMQLGNALTFFTTGIIGSFAILFLSLMIKTNFLLDIGKRSFDIMVLHYPPIGIIYGISSLLETIGMQHSLTKYIIVTLITTTICCIQIFIRSYKK